MKYRKQKLHKKFYGPKFLIGGLAIGVVLAITGSIGAMNGWFGGGNSIPEDTITRGLVGYWGFEEGSGGVVYDSSNYGNNGSSTMASWTKGKVGSALNFDGSNDYVNIGNVGNVQSVEFWVQDSNATDGILELIDNATYVSIAVSAITATGFTSPTIYVNGNSASASLASGWNHVVVTTATAVSAASFLIGEANTDYMAGTIDEVRVYNRALSPAEIRYHYNRGGPVGHWKFDEGEGRTVYDSTDNNNDGTLVLAGSATSSAWVAGKYGTALNFDGVDDYVSIPHNNSLVIANDITLEAWININPGQTGNPLVVGKYKYITAGNAGGYYLQWRAATSDLTFYIRNNGVYDEAGATMPVSGTLSTGSWHYIVGVRNGNNLNIYIDGVVSGTTGSFTTTIRDMGDIASIGSYLNGISALFNGPIDDVRIYNYARTPEEIRLDYNSGYAALFGPKSDCKRDPGSCMTQGLVGYWGFEEGSGGVAYDSSNYGNNGSSTMASWTKGKVGGALNFDGTNDYVDAGNNTTLQVGVGTIEAWVKPAVITGGAGIVYYVAGPPYDDGASWDSPYIGFQLAVAGNGVVRWFGSVGGTYQTFDSDASLISAGNWYYLTITWDGTTGRIYKDGAEVKNSSALGSGNITYGSPSPSFMIGQRSKGDDGEYFNGLIDEVRIYNRALSAEEVRYHYNKGGPAAQWKFDEGEGRTVYDSTDNNNDGTLVLVGSATSSAWVAGKYGTALSFDGTNDYVTLTSALTSSNAPISVSAWVKSNSIGADQFIIDESNIETYGGGLSMRIKTDGTIRFWQQDAVNAKVDSVTAVSVGQWYHLVGAYDGTNFKVYINGKLDNTATAGTVSARNAANPRIGSSSLLGGPFNGLIDDVRVYNRARTPDEIRLDYNSGLAAYFGPKSDCTRDPGSCITEDLVGYWSIDEGSGSVAYDSTDSNNDGAISGAAWTKGKVGSALSFDGTNDLVTTGISTATLLGSSNPNVTVAMWFKTNQNSAGTIMSGSAGSWYIYSSTAISCAYPNGDSAWGAAPASGVTPTVGQWYYVACVKDGNNVSIYVDGILKSTAAGASFNFTNNNNPLIGAYCFGVSCASKNQYHNGLVDEVRIYNRALSAEEIRYHYNRGGPVAQWKFDEGEGRTVYDSTDNNNDGTLVLAGSATSSAWVAGKYGSALSFDGVDDYVNVVASSDMNSDTNKTVSLWIYPINTPGTSAATFNRVFTKNKNSAALGYLIAYDNNTSAITKGWYGVFNNGSEFMGNFGLLTDNKWTYLTMVYTQGTSVATYVNGVVVSNIANDASFGFAANDNLEIGGRTGGTQYFNGLIDEVRIYNYARTPAQILQDYNSGFSTRFR